MATVEEGLQAQIRNIEAAYGKPMREWLAIIAASGLTKHTEIAAGIAAAGIAAAGIAAAGIAAELIGWLRDAYDRAG